MSEKSEKMKENIEEFIERKIDEVHGVVDVITGPLAPIDGFIHGTARGVLNWIIDEHPGKEAEENPKNKIPEECRERGGATSTPSNQSIQGNPNNQTNVSGSISGGNIGNIGGGNIGDIGNIGGNTTNK